MIDERIDRYIAEDMAPDERAAFETELEQSESLRAELEEARAILALAGQWFDDQAPGLERAAEIPIPQVKGTPARVYTIGRVISWTLKAAAILAIFLAGYATRAAKDEKAGDKVASPPNETLPAIHTAEPEKPATPRQTPPDGGREMAMMDNNYQRIIDNNGELIVETARSYWVVKPDLDLNDSTTPSEQR